MFQKKHFASKLFRLPRGWLKLRFVILVVLAISGIACSRAGQTRVGESDLSVLPTAAHDALSRAVQAYPDPLTGARWSSAAMTSGAEHRVFQVRGTNSRGNTIELEITGAGRIIEVEEHGIPLVEVPAAVTEALKARHPQFEPARVEAIYQGDSRRPVSYGFEGKDVNGNPIEIYISADGKTVLN